MKSIVSFSSLLLTIATTFFHLGLEWINWLLTTQEGPVRVNHSNVRVKDLNWLLCPCLFSEWSPSGSEMGSDRFPEFPTLISAAQLLAVPLEPALPPNPLVPGI